MTQGATLQIDAGAPTTQSLAIPGACVDKNSAKLGSSLATQPDLQEPTTTISIQPLADTYAITVQGSDTIQASNCGSDTEIEEVFRVQKTVQAGVLVATQFYSSAPTTFHSDYDRIALATFTSFAKDIRGLVPTVLITAPLDAKPHTIVSRKIVWSEIFRRGLVTVQQGTGIVIGDLTVEVPVGIAVDEAATDAQQPTVTQCS